MDTTLSGVGVLDKSVAILDALAAAGSATLGELVGVTGIPRATAHRLAAALEVHGLASRAGDGRWTLGPRLVTLGRAAADARPLGELALDAMAVLRDETGESVQLYVADGDRRICIAALESPHGLRTIVPLGASLPLDRGSGGSVLRGGAPSRGWVASVGEREPGVASVSAPVHDPDGHVIAAVSVSGPVDRTSRQPGRRYGPAVVAAARAIEAALGQRG